MIGGLMGRIRDIFWYQMKLATYRKSFSLRPDWIAKAECLGCLGHFLKSCLSQSTKQLDKSIPDCLGSLGGKL